MWIFFIIILIVSIFILLFSYWIGNFFYKLALNVEKSKAFIAKHHTNTETPEEKNQKEQNKKWLAEQAKEIAVVSKDGLRLQGYQIQCNVNSHNWVILIHGYTGNARQMVYAAKEFLAEGFHVLLIDLRGHGKSEGTHIGMGWLDRLDILQWIQEIMRQDNKANIVLYGISMGAAAVMMTIGELLPSNVKVAIEDSGYTSIWDEFAWELKTIFHLPPTYVLHCARWVAKRKAGYDIKQGSCIRQLQKTKIPILMIHGTEDSFVPFSMQEELYQAVQGKKQKLVVEGAAHVESYQKQPELYWNTIKEFIKENIES